MAIDYMKSPGPVAVINAMAPIAVYVNAYFVLHEKFGVVPVVNALLAIGGIIIMNLDELKNAESNDSRHVLVKKLIITNYYT